ncbi:MAG: mechanosensitive ion channel family protein [Pseudomonadales bacterium]|nr:mechanosensitive ion channel family protein [Pseudomonadales bacterium]NRA16580.1 mechanosensitive ion channel family protein [Oceanospirillaceae bacterium]
MNTVNTNRALLKLLLLISMLALSVSTPANPLFGNAEVVEDAITIPEQILPEHVGDFLAPLDEKQVRSLLLQQIRQQAENNLTSDLHQSMSVIALLKGAKDPSSPLGRGIQATLAVSDTFWLQVNFVFKTFVPQGGISGVVQLLAQLLAMLLSARFIEWLLIYRWQRSVDDNRALQKANHPEQRNSYAFYNFFINFIGLMIFSAAGFVLGDIITTEVTNLTATTDNLSAAGNSRGMLVESIFSVVLLYRLTTLLAKLLINPAPKGLGLIDETINIKALYRCIAGFTFAFLIGTEVLFLFFTNGLSAEHMLLAMSVLFGLVINPIIFWFVWSQRYDIDRVMFSSSKIVDDNANYPYANRALIWPSIVTFVITMAFLNWQIQVLSGDFERQQAIQLAWWITLLFPILDLLVSSLLLKLVALELFQTPGFQRRKQRFIFMIRSVVRLLLLSVLVISFLDAWGFQPMEKLSSSSGSSILSSTMDIGITILLGFLIWEAIQLWMERLLPDDSNAENAENAEIDGEGASATASRSETLLPLFRTILLILLLLIVVMSVLYSIGVQIGPLLAGASVIGIAIGFGSQKLVQDIISGMFFLIDDAFRKGEYVEVAGMKGTVEKLSVRSMRLRHHLGAVQTVPYGEINTVKNLSRDWVTMKLELRLPYDVDIEKVRKIIKKIGQKMLEDPEIGPNMLQPLKSQGVMRVEESALIIRMKFTAKPGEQWVVRRVAYTRVRDALAAAGIEFAHREVKVRLSDEMEQLQKLDYQNKLQHSSVKGEPELHTESAASTDKPAIAGAISAAAITAVLSSKIAKHKKIDDQDEQEQ